MHLYPSCFKLNFQKKILKSLLITICPILQDRPRRSCLSKHTNPASLLVGLPWGSCWCQPKNTIYLQDMSCVSSITFPSPPKKQHSPWRTWVLGKLSFPFWCFGPFLVSFREGENPWIWGGGTAPWDPRRTCSQIAGGDGGSRRRMESWTEAQESEGRCLIRVKSVHPYIHYSKGGLEIWKPPRLFTGALMHMCTGAVLPWILQLLGWQSLDLLNGRRSPWSHQERGFFGGVKFWVADIGLWFEFGWSV